MRDECFFEPESFHSLIGAPQTLISRENAVGLNELVKTAPSLTTTICDLPAALRVTPDVRKPSRDVMHQATLSYNDIQFKIFIPSSLVKTIFANRVEFTQVTDRLLELLIRYALKDLVSDLSSHLKQDVSLSVQIDADINDQITLPVTLCLGGKPQDWIVHLGGDFCEMVQFLPFCKISRDTRRGPKLRCEVELKSLPASLPQSALRNLSKGDLLFLAKHQFDEFMTLNCLDAQIAFVSPLQHACRITRMMEPITMRHPKHLEKRGRANGAAHTSIGQYLNMTVEVGKTEIPLEQAQALRDGMIVDLGQLNPEIATLRINGRPAAEGALLSVGQGVGFQVHTVIRDGS